MTTSPKHPATTPPKATPEPAPRQESLIDYPSLFPIKVMGEKVDGLVAVITAVARQFDPLFDATTIARMLDDFQRVLADLIAQPEQPLSTLRLQWDV